MTIKQVIGNTKKVFLHEIDSALDAGCTVWFVYDSTLYSLVGTKFGNYYLTVFEGDDDSKIHMGDAPLEKFVPFEDMIYDLPVITGALAVNNIVIK